MKRDITPHEDYGFFGPDSVTWKVWGYAATPLIGIQRATVVEELDPNLIAAVDATQANYQRLRTRYERTVKYFAMVAVADSRSVSKAADVLVKVHSKAIGIEPVSGQPYDANNPDSQLWILLTGWHSVLKAYEVYGPGKLTPEEENQYWEECAIAAELQTCDPADVPRTREGIKAYFEEMRPHLATSEAAQRMMDHLLNGPNEVLPDGLLWKPVKLVANASLRAGTIATMPHWMRKMGGVHQPRLVDLLVRPYLRAVFLTLNRSRAMKILVLKTVAPTTLPVVLPHWYGVPPTNPEVVTPADARARYGYAKPADAHRDLRARQHRRVFGDHQKPSDEGLFESQEVLGALA